MIHTFLIDDSSQSAKDFLKFIKSLNFVKSADDADWWNQLSIKEKKLIEQGLADLEQGKVSSNEKVARSIRQKIAKKSA